MYTSLLKAGVETLVTGSYLALGSQLLGLNKHRAAFVYGVCGFVAHRIYVELNPDPDRYPTDNDFINETAQFAHMMLLNLFKGVDMDENYCKRAIVGIISASLANDMMQTAMTTQEIFKLNLYAVSVITVLGRAFPTS